jgi:type IV pilus modification protein PilV
MKLNRPSVHSSRQQRGFTLLEVMISMVVLTVGLVSLLGVFGMAMASTQTAQEDLIAKQLAEEAMESIFTARNTSQLQWSDIQNTSNGGIFMDDPQFQPIYNPGTDGLVGTSASVAAGARVLALPGKDGLVGTADDMQLPLTNFQRSIQITPVVDDSNNPLSDLRTLTVTVQYTTPQFKFKKNYVLTGYISQYR